MLFLFLLLTITTPIPPADSFSPFPQSLRPTTHIYTISETNRSPVELLALDSLAGFLARTTPQLYRVSTYQWRNDSQDSYSIWLSTMEKNDGVTTDDSLLNSKLGTIVQKFVSTSSYVRCNATNESVSIAITLAAASDSLLLIAGDSTTATALNAINATLIQDVRNKLVDEMITSKVLSKMSKSVFVFQDPIKSQFLADWSIFARASTMQWNSSSSAQNLSIQRVVDRGAAFGWGPENDYVSTLNKHGIWVHASDYNKNFPALSNAGITTTTTTTTTSTTVTTSSTTTTTPTNKHTVSFMMTDGDNLQWTLGLWSTSQQWYGSKLRGQFPMGWTVSPSIVNLAPSAMEYILKIRTKR